VVLAYKKNMNCCYNAKLLWVVARALLCVC